MTAAIQGFPAFARDSSPTRETRTAKLGILTEGADDFRTLEVEIGRGFDIFRTYRTWGKPVFNSTINEILNPAGPYPPPELYLSFDATLDSSGRTCIAWADISGGVYDSDIDARVGELDALLTLSGHAYVSFHHEPERAEGTPPGGCGSPDDFKAAYWHFRKRVQARLRSRYGWAPSSITWVVALTADTFRGKHGGPERWWPNSSDSSFPPHGVGDDHLVGVAVYNKGLCHSKAWRTFAWLADRPWQFATSVGRSLFIGESGSVEGDDCGGPPPHGTAKAEWFRDALVYMRDSAPAAGFTPLEAFCYTDTGLYRVDSSPESLDAFRDLAVDPFFGGSGPDAQGNSLSWR
jgi:hypothetical protein